MQRQGLRLGIELATLVDWATEAVAVSLDASSVYVYVYVSSIGPSSERNRK